MIRPIKYTLAQGAKEGTGNTRCAGAHLACRHVDAHRNYRRDREKETARDRRISLPLPGKDFKANMPQSTLHMQMNSMPQDLMDSSPLALLQRLQFAGRQIPLCSSHLCNKIRTVRHSIILIETAKGHANKQICTIQDVNGNARNHASRIIHTWLSNTKDAYFKTVRISRQFTTNSVKWRSSSSLSLQPWRRIRHKDILWIPFHEKSFFLILHCSLDSFFPRRHKGEFATKLYPGCPFNDKAYSCSHAVVWAYLRPQIQV